jgi:TatD DNase family protein
MGLYMIDAHIHLDQSPAGSLHQEIDKWGEQGIQKVVAVSSDLSSSYRTLELKRRFPDFIFAAVGFHPEQPLCSEKDLLELFQLIKKERLMISAIGEVGLPHYELNRLEQPFEKYVETLYEFLKIAREEQLPVSLHAVHEKAGIALQLLKQAKIKKAHFHWLKADGQTVKEILNQGYYISVTPEVCYRERDQLLVKNIPISNLLIETDGPWPFSGPFSGRKTTPLFLKEIVPQISNIYHIPENMVITETTKNAYNLWGD